MRELFIFKSAPDTWGSCRCRHSISFHSFKNSVRQVLPLSHRTCGKEITSPKWRREDSNSGLPDPKDQHLPNSPIHGHWFWFCEPWPWAICPSSPLCQLFQNRPHSGLQCPVMVRPLHLVGPPLTCPRSKGQHIQEATEIRPGPLGDHNLRPATRDKRIKATKAQHRAF